MRLLSDRECYRDVLAVMDTLEVLSGRWKLPILAVLATAPMRFGNLTETLAISPRMLSKELAFLELAGLVEKNVDAEGAYQLSDYGLSLKDVIGEMKAWGNKHRARFLGTAAR